MTELAAVDGEEDAVGARRRGAAAGEAGDAQGRRLFLGALAGRRLAFALAAFETALAKSIKAGRVRKDISPPKVAAFIVAALTGIIGTVKNAQDKQLLRNAGAALLDYLDSLQR